MIPFTIEYLESKEDVALADKLYRSNITWMRFRARKIIGNDLSACMDIAHDCMVNMMKHLDTLKRLNEEKQRAYMAISVDNAALNYIKKHSRVTLMRKPEAAVLDFVSEDYSLEEDLEKQLNIEAVRDNFHLLQKRDRDIIILKYELRLSDAEIGEILDIKPDNVRMTLRRSVQKLAKLVDGQVER